MIKKLGLVLLAVGLLWAAAASAEARLAASPSQLTLAAPGGTVETRALLLRATERITDVRVISLDLYRSDGGAVLPAARIEVGALASVIAADEVITLPLTFNLSGAASGEYSGDLLVKYHGGELAVPVTVRVKDPALLPLIVLVIGAGVGVWSSAYRAKGRPRDEALVRVGRLRAQIKADEHLNKQEAEPFRSRMEALFVDVDVALLAEKIEAAQQAIEQAEAVLVKWRKSWADWLAQLTFCAELSKRLEGEGDVPYTQAARRALEVASRDAPDFDSPDKLREQLDKLAAQINRYVRLRARAGDVYRLAQVLPVNQQEEWRVKSLGLQRKLDDLRPDDTTAYQELESRVEEAIKQVTAAVDECIRQGAVRGGPESTQSAKGVRDIAGAIQLLAPAPLVRSFLSDAQVTGARSRLWLFALASSIIAVVFLVGLGFAELYAARPTFGVGGWADYLALLAWGFGAEATRASVLEMIRGWGLPVGK